MLEINPSLYTNEAPSFDLRLEILKRAIPELGKAAALEAIKEWGRPVSEITHLVFATSSDRIVSPSADLELAKLLGLRPSVRRHMIYQQACFAAGAALRLSKDLAENNAGARILVVCAENTVLTFSAPSAEKLSMLIGMAILGDGAAATIVGADTDNAHERPLFRMVSAAQTFLPDTGDAIVEELRESGSVYWLSREIPSRVGGCVRRIMEEAFEPFGISDWDSLFYAVHPGGRAVLDRVEENLGLGGEKLEASRHVLGEYGNMRAATVLFALNEVRKKAGTGWDGPEWGVLMAFGPGITVETIVLRSEVSA